MNVLEKGYGITSKVVIKDKKINVKAKGVYIFLCSYADENGISFPRRETIMKYLGIGSKNTYYKYLNELLESQYITVKQEKIEGRFTPNVYTIKRSVNGTELFKNSFGIVPRAVMEDKNLSIESKVVYTYLSCYSNKNKLSFMNIDQIKTELNISYININKSLKKLLEYNYIEKNQNKVNYKYSSNSYVLLHYPNSISLKIQEPDTNKAIENIAERDEKRKENSTRDNAKEKLKKDLEIYETIVKENIKFDVIDQMFKERTIENKRELLRIRENEGELQRIRENKGELERTIENERELQRMRENYGEIKGKYEFYNNVVSLIIDTIFSDEDTYLIQGSNKPKELVVSVLLKLNHEHIEFAFEKVKKVAETGYIRNPKAYLLNVLYASTQDIYIDKTQRK